ncbi:MAG: hypothetical protein K8U03_24520 [Planctomycetia bacterium]|nr:hypothetical protein [Planctomycetia bacterium]
MSTSLARRSVWMIACLLALGCFGNRADAAEGTAFDIGSKYTLTAPADWLKKEPRSRIVEYEFEIPKVEGDEFPGRVTVMGAGGGVEANVERWKGQFKPTEGDEVKAETKKSKVAEQDVYVVDIKGTYIDKPAPMAPTPGIDRPKYRMIGAIIATDGGQYFVKAYGPEKTMEKALPGFQKMVEGLKAK